MKRLLARAVLLSLGATIPDPAWAADRPVDGSLANSLLNNAAVTNSRIFGAAGFLERTLLPTLRAAPGGVLIVAESNMVQAVLQPPAEVGNACVLGDIPTCPLGKLDVDVFSSTGGWGIQLNDNLALFYTASATGSRVGEAGTEVMYPLLSGSLMGLGFFGTYFAPLMTGPLKIMEGFGGFKSEYIIGGSVSVLGISARAGFVGSDTSNGLFLSAMEDTLHLSGSTVLSDSLKRIPYLKLGIDRLPNVPALLGFGAPVENKPANDDGEGGSVTPLSSLYVRRLFFEPVLQQGQVAVADPASFLTVHLEHLNYPLPWGYLDVGVAAALRPEVLLHEVRASLHSATMHAQSNENMDEIDVSVSLGYVNMPTMRYYGDEGGGRLSYAVTVQTWRISATVSRNDTDMVARFPYARSGTNFYLRLRIPEWWGEDD